jgi:hypothetical protein
MDAQYHWWSHTKVRASILHAPLATELLFASMATFLKETLRIDIARFIALFGFLWDFDNLLLTQKARNVALYACCLLKIQVDHCQIYQGRGRLPQRLTSAMFASIKGSLRESSRCRIPGHSAV